jgi:cell division protein FtsL
MTIIGKLIAPRSRKPPTAGPEGVRTYRAEAVRLVAVARESGLRFQRQWVISFVAVVGMLALLAALYLNVTASASIAGRQIQNLEVDIVTNEQVNADLETQIATLMSDSVLEQRAQMMGFVPVDRTKLEYIVVPGYFSSQPVSMVSSTVPAEMLSSSPEFNETLIDWISEQLAAASLPLSEVKH